MKVLILIGLIQTIIKSIKIFQEHLEANNFSNKNAIKIKLNAFLELMYAGILSRATYNQ